MVRAAKQKVGVNKKIAYVARVVRYSTISGKEVAEHASADTGVNLGTIRATGYALAHQIKQMLMNGHAVEFPGLGFFYLALSAKVTENAEDVSADLIRRKRIRFRLKDELQTELQRRVKVDIVVDDEE